MPPLLEEFSPRSHALRWGKPGLRTSRRPWGTPEQGFSSGWVTVQPGSPGNADWRAPPRVGRAHGRAGAGRRVAGAAGRRAAAEELPGAGVLALPSGACSRQRGVPQVSGRWGHGDAGRWAAGPWESALSFLGHPLPCPAPSNPQSSTSRKAATFLWHRSGRGAVSADGFQQPGSIRWLSPAPGSLALVTTWPLLSGLTLEVVSTEHLQSHLMGVYQGRLWAKNQGGVVIVRSLGQLGGRSQMHSWPTEAENSHSTKFVP
ncbi:hypothetical protein LEMLEM_LOCUS23184 [Lemmus lemmus]